MSIDLKGPWLGYGPVNFWDRLSGDQVAAWIQGLVKAQAEIALIEFIGWQRYAQLATDVALQKQVIGAFDGLLDACRKNGITLFVSIANDNKGSGKYGDDHLGLDHYQALIEGCAQFLAGKGTDHLVVQPVAETRTAAGSAFELYCDQKLGAEKGFSLVYNGGAQPRSIPSNLPHFRYIAWHPASATEPVRTGVLNVGDHGGILAEFQYRDAMGERIDRRRVEAYAAKCLESNGNFGYYGFVHHSPSADVLACLYAARFAGAQSLTSNEAYNASWFNTAARADRVTRRLYRAVLGRDADPGGLAAYTAQIQGGGLLKAVASLYGSAEFKGRLSRLSRGELASALYVELLDRKDSDLRDADWGGFTSTVQAVAACRALQRTMDMVLSAEYQSRNR